MVEALLAIALAAVVSGSLAILLMEPVTVTRWMAVFTLSWFIVGAGLYAAVTDTPFDQSVATITPGYMACVVIIIAVGIVQYIRGR